MAPDDWPEWLPATWTIQIKKIDERTVKCYLDPEGHTFFSKPQVFRHLKNINNSTASDNTHNADGSTGDISLEPDVPYKSEVPESAPRRRIIRLTTGSSRQKSKGDKSSTEPDKFQKSEATKVRNNKAKKKKAYKAKKKRGRVRKSFDYEVISRTPADGLPPGWIKEIRMRKLALPKKKDPYYLDPLSGYTFFSKLDALRYLDTGDIKKCAMRPLKRDISAEDYHDGDNLTGGILASQPDLSKGNETSEALPNGCVVELKTKRSGAKRKARDGCLTGDGSSSKPDASRKGDVSEWLPDGWIMEVKTRDCGSRIGMRYKRFTDPVSGRKFFSKPQVLNYLARANSGMARKRKGGQTSSEPDTSQNSEAADVGRRKRSKKKKKRIRKSPHNEVISTSPADGLPPGWIKEIKIRKYGTHERKNLCYLDPEGHKYYSKPQVFRHLKTINNSTASDKTHNADGSTGDISLEPDVPHKSEVPESAPQRRITNLTTGNSSKKSKETVGYLTGDGSSSEPDASQKGGVSEWLPDGWFIEVKTRDCGSRIGMKYKCYTDPVSGRKFFSKPQVLNYLANTNSHVARKRKGDQSSTEPDKSQKSEATKVRNNKAKKKKRSVRKSFDYEVISRTPADGLPPGWMKEIRMRKHATLKKKDPFYLDPLSGYAFFSKLDALRYLDTGDIKTCAMRPLKGHINAEDNASSPLA